MTGLCSRCPGSLLLRFVSHVRSTMPKRECCMLIVLATVVSIGIQYTVFGYLDHPSGTTPGISASEDHPAATPTTLGTQSSWTENSLSLVEVRPEVITSLTTRHSTVVEKIRKAVHEMKRTNNEDTVGAAMKGLREKIDSLRPAGIHSATLKAPSSDAMQQVIERLRRVQHSSLNQTAAHQKHGEQVPSSSIPRAPVWPSCFCTSPNAGTAGKNRYECDDGTIAYCMARHACTHTGKFLRTDIDIACGTIQEVTE